MATNSTAQNRPSAEEIKQITAEVDSFKEKSIQLASTSPTMSAHYWRLYQASAPSLKRFDRMARAAERRSAQETRKQARAGQNGTTQPTPRAVGGQTRA
jgi:hypothetical protein